LPRFGAEALGVGPFALIPFFGVDGVLFPFFEEAGSWTGVVDDPADKALMALFGP
jgi:hypothetical protein